MIFELPEKRLPDEEGWWARRRGGEIDWFKVEWIDYGTELGPGNRKLSVYMSDLEDCVPVEKLSSPLTRWSGPVAIKGDD